LREEKEEERRTTTEDTEEHGVLGAGTVFKPCINEIKAL
jgi:hypothetical protein